MALDELLQQMHRRLNDYQLSRSSDTILDESVLAEAAALWRAAQPTDPDHPTPEDIGRLTAAHQTLGWLHFLRYTALPTGANHGDLARAIIFLQPLANDIGVVPDRLHVLLGPAADAHTQASLAADMLNFARTTADPMPIYASINLLTAAVATIPDDHPDRALYLSNLGGAYQERFARGGVVADLERSIELGEQALAITPGDYPDRGMYLSQLGGSYLKRFGLGGEEADLDKAIDLGEQAVQITPESDDDWGMYVSNLSILFRERFRRGGPSADLDRAIELNEQALEITPDHDADRTAMLSNLAAAYEMRFRRDGLSGDLDRAVELSEQGVACTPDNHSNQAMYRSNLGIFYVERFRLGGVWRDLDRAIELGEQAVAATPDYHPDRAAVRSYLGTAYRRRFDRGGVAVDLDRAIELGEQAVAATPDGRPDRAMYLSNLGTAYRRRFDRDGLAVDLDRAIELGEQAVAATSHDHPDRARQLSNLGLAYQARFGQSGVPVDLDRAIELGEQAVAATPDDHPDRAGQLSNIGTAYQARFDVDGRGIGREALRTLTRQVISATTGSPVDRVRANRVVGSLAYAMNQLQTAVKLLDTAVAVLPSVAPRETGWTDQEHRLGEHLGLVGEAVAAHCAVNDLVGAVEVAELGRGILLAAQLDSRTDLTDLEHANPELAAQFRQIRSQLNTPDTTPDNQPNNENRHVNHQKRLWAEHDQLVTRIRQHTSFTRFLLPPRLTDLRPAAAEGAVLLVNASRWRSDAIIITADADPVPVTLPNLALTDVQSHAITVLGATHDDTHLAGTLRKQRILPPILSWLWDTVVGPILDALPPPSPSTEPSQARVWWMPIGLLGLFPFHAAGHPGQPGALDRVVSSYTPTLRALAHTRSQPPATARRQLTVALQHTPGLPDLPGTVAEAAYLHAHHPDTPLLTDHHATTDRVLAALTDATWAHFACHASADLATPSRGGLQLHDDTLPIPDISRLQLTHAELAYLSACSTAHRGWRHAEESIHLASAFQLAGFRHVIASLWPIDDHIAATAARSFYHHLPTTCAADHASTALRHVTLDLRAHHPHRPDLWAPLIHSGP